VPVTLGLDLAALCGAVWGEAFEPPTIALWNVRAKNIGDRGLKLMGHLTALVDEVKPSKAFIEAPLKAHVAASMGTTHETTICLNGYVFLAATVLASRGIPWLMLDRQKVLGHFVGQERFKVKDEGKRACVVRCKQLGWGDLTFDEADAAALWDYGNATDNPRGFALHGVTRAVQRRRAT
jgi:hypothetical protein